jgi:hypothetical protein
VARIAIEIAVASIGVVLVAWALVANQQWFDSHFLPAFFVSRRSYVAFEWIGRIGAAVIGLLLLFLARQRAGRFVARNPLLVVSAIAAVILSVGASELVLTQLHLHVADEEPAGPEPRRRLDARLGWTFMPSRSAERLEGGRLVEYAFDAAGYRVRRVNEPVDPDRPSILFTGESIMAGQGLMWDESIPAQVEASLGVQSANLAVYAYATDQAYMRLRAELPRFRQPVAVVTLFTPTLFNRNMDDNRPHLGPGLVWQPPVQHSRLLDIIRLLVRYRKVETIERGIAATREVLRATVDLAHSRNAAALIVVPQFVPEEPTERALRQGVLDGAGLPIVRVELDGTWRIRGDGHPDARAARVIASEIAARLRAQLSQPPEPRGLP